VRQLPYPKRHDDRHRRRHRCPIAITGDVTLTVGELAPVSIILQEKENVLWLPPGPSAPPGRNFCVVQNPMHAAAGGLLLGTYRRAR